MKRFLFLFSLVGVLGIGYVLFCSCGSASGCSTDINFDFPYAYDKDVYLKIKQVEYIGSWSCIKDPWSSDYESNGYRDIQKLAIVNYQDQDVYFWFKFNKNASGYSNGFSSYCYNKESVAQGELTGQIAGAPRVSQNKIAYTLSSLGAGTVSGGTTYTLTVQLNSECTGCVSPTKYDRWEHTEILEPQELQTVLNSITIDNIELQFDDSYSCDSGVNCAGM